MDNFDYKLKELDVLVKKLMRSIYIEKYMSDKSIVSKINELSNIKTTDKVVLYVLSSILKYDVIMKIVSRDRFYYIDRLKSYIEKLNCHDKLRLDEIICDGAIDIDKLNDVLLLLDNIEGFYYYNNKIKTRENMKNELNKLKLLVEQKALVNKKIYPLICLIAEEIEFINCMEIPKFYKLNEFISYKKTLKSHKSKICDYTLECLKYLDDDKYNYMSGYFYYEDSIHDIIMYIKEYLESSNYISVFNCLKGIYDTNVDGIRISKSDIKKREEKLNRFHIVSNPYYDNINDTVLNKKSRCICYIVNFLYKINANTGKQKLFYEVVYTLKLLYNISNKREYDFSIEFNDNEISFLKSLFEGNVDEKSILGNIEMYKKIIEKYKEDDYIKKL